MYDLKLFKFLSYHISCDIELIQLYYKEGKISQQQYNKLLELYDYNLYSLGKQIGDTLNEE